MLNLYPFEQVVGQIPTASMDEIIENIDIGGPAMLRSAAKNLARVAVATDPAQYAALRRRAERATTARCRAHTRFALAVAAFNRVAQYDGCDQRLPVRRSTPTARARCSRRSRTAISSRCMDLRYGENPHQHGAFYRDLRPVPGTLATFTQLQGKELSFNNLADADAAWECVRQFERPACVIVKHANPVRRGRRRRAAWTRYEAAYATDPTSAFGGIIAFNRTLDARHRQGDPRPPVRRGADRAGLRRRRARLREEEGERARAAASRMATAATTSTSSASARAC